MDPRPSSAGSNNNGAATGAASSASVNADASEVAKDDNIRAARYSIRECC